MFHATWLKKSQKPTAFSCCSFDIFSSIRFRMSFYPLKSLTTDTCPPISLPIYIHISSFLSDHRQLTFSLVKRLSSPTFSRILIHLYMLVAMTAVKQSSVTGDFRKHNDRKTATLKVLEECDPESYGSSSEETETYSPKSVVSKARKWPATVKDVNVDVFGRRTRNQIERIRAEDSHLGEDIGECLIAKVSVGSHDLMDVMIFSRPASPLSGKVAAGMNTIQ
ncbi:hypothetical protein L1887_31780 [Cichorium endivia]|nr:hypothetical protein L1887_31780 [Cichorium endivia]